MSELCACVLNDSGDKPNSGQDYNLLSVPNFCAVFSLVLFSYSTTVITVNSLCKFFLLTSFQSCYL